MTVRRPGDVADACSPLSTAPLAVIAVGAAATWLLAVAVVVSVGWVVRLAEVSPLTKPE